MASSFFTGLRYQSQVRELYGYRILNVKYVPKSILFQGSTNAQNSYEYAQIQQEQFISSQLI